MNFAADSIVCGQRVRAEVVALDDVPASWDKAWTSLAVRASEPNPFAEPWFMRAALDNLGIGRLGRMIGVWRGDLLLGLLPVEIVGRYGRLPVRHVENWMHYHCFYGAPLVAAGEEASFWDAVLRTLDRANWARAFLHLVALDENGPVFAGLRSVRRTDIVHRTERALLRSDLGPGAYLEAHIRPKKRKELRRLRARLDELGTVAFLQFREGEQLDTWVTDFLELEASGWKGREGTALAGAADTTAFFKQAIASGQQTGRLDMLKMTFDGKPIAMLVTFVAAPGAFAFKIAFDEDYARFSPGVLIKIENLKMLDDAAIDWVDSCAVEDHPMINSLWAQRRSIVRVTVPLSGARRTAAFHMARAVETTAARLRAR